MASPTTDRRLGLVGNIAMKTPVTVLAASNITLSGQQTIDGVAVLASNAAGVPDRVLCVGQTSAAQNGIWDVNTGSWTRSLDANGNYDMGQGSTVTVNQGTVYAGTYWKLTTAGQIAIGTTALTWAQALATSLQTSTFTQLGTGAVQRDAQSKMRESVSILDFIPVAQHAAIKAYTSVYDCYAAIIAAITSVTYNAGGSNIAAPAIYFPPGLYNVSTRIELKRTVRLWGDYSGMQYSSPPILKWAAGVAGITVNATNTINGGIESPVTYSADASIIEGVLLWGGGGAAAIGVWLRARALLRNVYMTGWSGEGIHIAATAGGGGSSEGNANLWRLEGVTVQACGSHGVFVTGADVNAGYAVGLNCMDNGGWGVWDSSFLGNTYVACHTSGNTLGAYKSSDVNARNLFLNCYSEGGQPTSSILPPAVAVGGLHAAGLAGPWLAGGSAGMAATPISHASADTLNSAHLGSDAYSGDPTATVLAIARNAVGTWRGKVQTGAAFFDWNNVAAQTFMIWYDSQATLANGYARTLASGPANTLLGFPNGFLGSGMRARVDGTLAPPSTAYQALQGDIIWNTAASSGNAVGWYCTVAGTPGTWRAFGTISTST